MNTPSILEKLSLPIELDVKGITINEFVEYYNQNDAAIENNLRNVGAIKFKNVRIGSADDFQSIVDNISSKFLSYIDGNSPRTKLSGNVYTSTEYDKSQRITMHNELSYSAKWPNKLFFSCIEPATHGGETLLADSRLILDAIPRRIVDLVLERGVMYIRNLHSGMGMGPSWQDTFETEDKVQLEKYLKNYSIDFEWLSNGNLRLRHKSKGIIQHRLTHEMVWFNQIDQFHPIQLGEEIYSMMKGMYDSEEEFPMHVKFGDGSRVGEDMISEILNCIERVTVAPKWSENELLIVDNELVSHGRNPFEGTRRVLVAMSE